MNLEKPLVVGFAVNIRQKP
jgi:hypothetical protein